jgi:DNA-binding response OmpR family regulator
VRILLADYDTAFLEIMCSYLSKRGHQVVTAGNGLECIAKARDFAPDVMVLQRGLLWGGSDGVMAEMREDLLLCHVPVILITDEAAALMGRMHSQVAACLAKPFRNNDLLRHVTGACKSPETACQEQQRE